MQGLRLMKHFVNSITHKIELKTVTKLSNLENFTYIPSASRRFTGK